MVLAWLRFVRAGNRRGELETDGMGSRAAGLGNFEPCTMEDFLLLEAKAQDSGPILLFFFFFFFFLRVCGAAAARLA